MVGRIMHMLGEDLTYQFACWRYRLTVGGRHEPVRVLVNGSPKTGTTWMVRLVTSLPGYRAVGNFGSDHTRYRTVQLGDVVHGHDWYSAELGQLLLAMGIKVILMVRDPRDQLVSRMFHVKRSPDHTWHERFKSMSNDEALMLCIDGDEGLPGAAAMIRLTQTWLDSQAALIVRYEEMLNDPEGGMRVVLNYLGVPATRNLVEAVVARNRFKRLSAGRRLWRSRPPGQEDASSHFRKGIVGDWRNYLSEAHIRRFKKVAGEQLIDLGYESDMDWGSPTTPLSSNTENYFCAFSS